MQSAGLPGTQILVDFPGFGESSAPPPHWGVADYAAFMTAFIQSRTPDPVIWIGHSLGNRVGVHVAAGADRLQALISIGGHGIKPHRPWWKRLKMALSVRLFKTLKLLVRSQQQLERLRARFGSPDYRNAGPMRPVFMNVVRDDVTDLLPGISCPAHFFYGTEDRETPPAMGRKMAETVQNGRFEALPYLDHYSILNEGRHQLASRLKSIIKEL